MAKSNSQIFDKIPSKMYTELEVVVHEGFEEPFIQAAKEGSVSLNAYISYPLTFMMAEGSYIVKQKNDNTFIVGARAGMDMDYLDAMCDLTGKKGDKPLDSVLFTLIENTPGRAGVVQGKKVMLKKFEKN